MVRGGMPARSRSKVCNAATVANSEMVKGQLNVGIIFSPEVLCLDPKGIAPLPGGRPGRSLVS